MSVHVLKWSGWLGGARKPVFSSISYIFFSLISFDKLTWKLKVKNVNLIQKNDFNLNSSLPKNLILNDIEGFQNDKLLQNMTMVLN